MFIPLSVQLELASNCEAFQMSFMEFVIKVKSI